MTSVAHDAAPVTPWGKIEVTKFTPTPNAGNLRALATITIGPLTIHGCRIIQQPGQAAWVAMPQRQDDGGRWFPVVATDDESVKAAVRSALLNAWASWQAFRVGGGK